MKSCTIGAHIAEIILYLHSQQHDHGQLPTTENLEGRGLFMYHLGEARVIHSRLQDGIRNFSSRRGWEPNKSTVSPDSDEVFKPEIYHALLTADDPEMDHRPSESLDDQTLGQRIASGSDEVEEIENNGLTFFNSNLDFYQRSAVRLSIAQLNRSDRSSVLIVEGPPGTGKTETAIEIIRQFCSIAEKDGGHGTIIQMYFPTNPGARKFRERMEKTGGLIFLIWDFIMFWEC